MESLVIILRDGGHSLVVAADSIYTFDGRGISDLYNLLTRQPELLRGSAVADKVVGKGAAALMIAGGVRRLHAVVISTSARRLLEGSDIAVTFDREVPFIINRRGDGVCPVEALCTDCTTAEECIPLIKEFITKMRHNTQTTTI